jgi:transposase, IS5 family
MIVSGARLSGLKGHWWHKLLVISELHCQQSILLSSKRRSIPDRIVNVLNDKFVPLFVARQELLLSLAP